MQEASGIALGNLALSGLKVVRVLLNQEVLDSLVAVADSQAESAQTAGFYALYHILHVLGAGAAEVKAVAEALAAREGRDSSWAKCSHRLFVARLYSTVGQTGFCLDQCKAN